MPDNEGRNIDFGGEFLPPNEVSDVTKARQLRLRELVNSPFYQDLNDLIAETVGSYKVEPPRREHDRYAYEIYNQVRDAFIAFQWKICEGANAGEIRARGGQPT